MKLIQDNDLKNKYSFIAEYELSYNAYVEDSCIGFSALNLNSENMICIYVKPEYRGNGLGKDLFELMINKIKETNIKEISLFFDSNNIKMEKIISSYPAYEIFRGKDVVSYKIILN